MKSVRIIEIKALENGAHRNQTWNDKTIPEGFALIPDYMETPNFPFGEIATEEIDGVVTVTKWIAGAMPKSEDVEAPPTDIERLRADIEFIALMTGVEL